MLQYSREAVTMASGRSEGDLGTDRMLELSLVRLVEIIGEAAARVSPETQACYPQIPWAVMVGMRNRLIHGYDRIALDVLWDTITRDLPAVIAELEKILRCEDE